MKDTLVVWLFILCLLLCITGVVIAARRPSSADVSALRAEVVLLRQARLDSPDRHHANKSGTRYNITNGIASAVATGYVVAEPPYKRFVWPSTDIVGLPDLGFCEVLGVRQVSFGGLSYRVGDICALGVVEVISERSALVCGLFGNFHLLIKAPAKLSVPPSPGRSAEPQKEAQKEFPKLL